MNRIFLISVLFITASASLYSQSFGIGMRIGPNVSTLLIDDEYFSPSFDWGGQVDVYVYKMFNKFVGIEGGLMLTKEGFRLKGADEDGGDDSDTDIKYFAIPLSARFKFGYFTLNPGIRPSFLMKAKDEVGNATHFITVTNPYISFFVSPGVQFPIGITLSSTIYLGVIDVFPDTEMANSKNFSLQFSVGYTFLRKDE